MHLSPTIKLIDTKKVKIPIYTIKFRLLLDAITWHFPCLLSTTFNSSHSEKISK